MPDEPQRPAPVEPMREPARQLTTAQKIAIAIAGGVAVAAPIAQRFEGYRGQAYYDPAHVLTQCYGETAGVRPDLIYSKDQCAAKLRDRMAKDYAPGILKCVPAFIDPKLKVVFGAAIDASYNAGVGGVCKSPMARAFKTGRWREGCAAFRGWFTTARNRRTGVRTSLPGLVRRRDYERDVCLAGLG